MTWISHRITTLSLTHNVQGRQPFSYLARLSHIPWPPYLAGSSGAPILRTITFRVTLRPRSPASCKRFCTSMDKLVRKHSASSTWSQRKGDMNVRQTGRKCRDDTHSASSTWSQRKEDMNVRQTGGKCRDDTEEIAQVKWSSSNPCEADVVVHLSWDRLPFLLVADRPVIESPAEAEQGLSGPGSKLLLQLRQRHLLEVPTWPHTHSS